MRLKRYTEFLNEEADVETEMEKKSQQEEKRLLQKVIQGYNSGKGKLEALLKRDPKDMQKLAIKIVGENELLDTYWTLIQAEKKADDSIEKTDKLKDKVREQQDRLKNPDERASATDRLKEINLEIKQLALEKKELDLVIKNLQKNIKEKLSLLKQKITLD